MNKLLALLMLLIILNKQAAAQITPTRIQAENWTAMSGVLTETTQDVDGTLNVGWIDQGDWMDYSINVPTSGSYKIALRIATGNSGAVILMKNAAGVVLKTVELPATWGFQTWATVYTYVNLNAGTQTLRFESGAVPGWNINWFDLSTTSTTKIEAEAYTAMSGIVSTETAWNDPLKEGASDMIVSNIDLGDWMEYSFNAPIAGAYTINLRSASINTGSELQVKNAGGAILATVSIANSGGYQNWVWATPATITLPAGQQTLRIQSTAAPIFNINFFELVAPASGGPNVPPTVSAGPDQSITLPVNQITLYGSASDADGTIASQVWTKVSAPTPDNSSFSSTTVLSPLVTGLTVAGAYTFRLTVTDNGGANADDLITITVLNAPSTSAWTMNGNVAGDADFIGTTNNKPLLFKANNRTWARLTQLGTFEVNKIKVTATGWADYVFDSSYRLRSLHEVQAYIQKHKHLPDVPSALEVRKEGLNIGDNQRILLQKIEELTLYMIEQGKKIDKQNRQLEKQAKEIKSLQKWLQQKRK